MAGFGFIARNSAGEILAASTSDPTEAEALSFRWAMFLAVDLGFRRVCFETDCLPLFEAWKRNLQGPSYKYFTQARQIVYSYK